MAKKVFLGVGHGGNDPGAVGYIKEADVETLREWRTDPENWVPAN